MIKIAQAAESTIAALNTGVEIYRATASAMDAVEAVGVLTGAKKKDAVLTMIRDLVIELGENWEYWAGLLIKFIDAIKTAYNAIKALF